MQSAIQTAIETWLDLPFAALGATLVALYGGSAALIWWLSFASPLRGWLHSFAGIVPPLINAAAIFFVLLTGFMASDIAERNRHAARAVLAEADGLRTIHTLTTAAAADMPEVRGALRAYLQTVLADEWPQMATRGESDTAHAAFDRLMRAVAEPGHATRAGQAMHSALLLAAQRVGSARLDRLTLSTDHAGEMKWLTVLLLGIVALTAIGAVHLERPRAQAAALALFTAAAVIALTLIAAQDQPFTGSFSVSPAPLQGLLDGMPAPDA